MKFRTVQTQWLAGISDKCHEVQIGGRKMMTDGRFYFEWYPKYERYRILTDSGYGRFVPVTVDVRLPVGEESVIEIKS